MQVQGLSKPTSVHMCVLNCCVDVCLHVVVLLLHVFNVRFLRIIVLII